MIKRLQHGQRGQGLLEFAVIFPIFALLIFAVIDGGLLMGRYNNINNAAKEGARLGAVGADWDAIITRVQQQAHGELDTASTNCGDMAVDSVGNVICVQWITGAETLGGVGAAPGEVGASVRVMLKYRYKLITPLINRIGHWDITACAVQREERPVDVNDAAIAPHIAASFDSCAGGAGGVPSTPTAVPTNTPLPTATNTPVATPTCDPGNNGNHCRATQTALAASPTPTNTPAPPTNTPAPPTPTPCPNGNSQAAQNCRATATSVAQTATAMATP